MPRVLAIFFLALLASPLVQGQRSYKPKGSPFKSKFADSRWYTYQGQYSRLGIHFSAGVTYTLNRLNNPEEGPSTGVGNEQRYVIDPKGKLGWSVDVGLMHIMKNKPRKRYMWLHYVDWAIGARQYGAKEETTIRDFTGGTEVGSFTGVGSTDNGYIWARGAIHNVWQVHRYGWFDNSLGIHAGYGLWGRDMDHELPGVGGEMTFQNNWDIGLYYQLGYALKIRENFFIIPQVSLPLVTAFDWDMARPTFRWFHSRYYPITVSVRFAWLFKKNPNDCPPALIGDDIPQDTGGGPGGQ